MGIFNTLFGGKKEPSNFQSYYKLLNGYTPVFTNWNGMVYESELCRTAIDAIARHSSKLQITAQGGGKRALKTQMLKAPNGFQTWSQFLYRTTTILYATNTAFIVPVLNQYAEITGVYPIAPQKWELVNTSNDTPWIRFTFENGDKTAFKLSEVGILTRYQYKNDLFGEDNKALHDTMNLIAIQRQGIEESAKNAASYRFMAQVNNFTRSDDLVKERERFDAENMQSHGGGLLLFPNTYQNIQQLQYHAYAVDEEQMALIQRNVYNYFGVNEDVIQNKAYGDSFSAFYEGCLEVIAVQLSEVLTKMIFTQTEIGFGNQFFFTANRMQYMTNADKLNVSAQMIDRGVMSINEVREIWNLPPIDGGDDHVIRGEYYNLDEKMPDSTGEEDDTDGNEE